MKTLLAILFALCALPAAASETFQASLQAAPHPGMYSFVDVYRLTVSGAALADLRALGLNDSPVRVAVSAAAPASDAAAFSIAGVGEPRGWLLLSGLALALWVARRRLGHAF